MIHLCALQNIWGHCLPKWNARDQGVKELNYVLHSPSAIMWLLQQKLKPRYIWLVEWDAFFSGNIASFFRHYRNDTADLITTPVILFTKAPQFIHQAYHCNLHDTCPWGLFRGQ